MTLDIGTRAPQFTLSDQSGEKHTLASLRGKWVLLYFYPKDNTPGCTTEACAIRDAFSGFAKLNAVVLGVSADSAESHDAFVKKYKLPFPLLVDTSKKVLTAYGAWRKKLMFGKAFFGIKRMSYLIDPKGNIAKVYASVKPAAHAAQVLADIRSMST